MAEVGVGLFVLHSIELGATEGELVPFIRGTVVTGFVGRDVASSVGMNVVGTGVDTGSPVLPSSRSVP